MASARNVAWNPVDRRRTAYACDSCRIRKTRCDGHNPCSNCSASAVECIYGPSTSRSKDKSDIILNTILRVERSVNAIESKISAMPTGLARDSYDQDLNLHSMLLSSPSNRLSGQATHLSETETSDIDNAVMSASHTSNTELVLQWPHFAPFTLLQQQRGESMFSLENRRPDIMHRHLDFPYSSQEDIEIVLESFVRVINFSYPIVSVVQISQLQATLKSGDFEDNPMSCIALVAMALGCAGEVMKGMLEADHQPLVTLPPASRFQSLGHAYFKAALQKIHHAYAQINIEATQCFLLTALYYAYLQRPLQAWSLLNATATKCRVLLSYEIENLSHDEHECLRRIFWSCYILESDYLAELTALPQFGISEMESSVSLPGTFETHEDQTYGSLSTLYFLACISMRRLLNRSHHLLFDKDTGAHFDDNRLPGMVDELNDQLNKWKELLPSALQFSVDIQAVSSQHGAFLRQRFLVCKALIYRPYMMRAIGDPLSTNPPDVTIIDRFVVWLEACLMHMINLGSFDQTVIVDTWIASLSMAGSMLMLLAAYRTPCLQKLLDRSVFDIGRRLQNLITRWLHLPGQPVSPSVDRALYIITIVDNILQETCHRDI